MADTSRTPRPQGRKVMITCAVTGAIHTPSMSPHLPITAEEIAEAAVAAAEAGAALVHLHARDPKDGRPDQSPAAFEPFGTLHLSSIFSRTSRYPSGRSVTSPTYPTVTRASKTG